MAVTETLIAWAINNSDPANLVILIAVYYKLHKEHSVQSRAIVRLAEEHPDVDADHLQ